MDRKRHRNLAMELFRVKRKKSLCPEIGRTFACIYKLKALLSYFSFSLKRSPIGGTLPGRKSKNKPIKDSGSSGPDRDKSSGSKKSERTKSRDKIARKPSKELLRIQNYTDSSDEDFNLMTRKEKISRKSNSNSNESPYNNNSNSNQDRREERCVTDGGASSKTDIASSLSPSSSKRSPNISRQCKNSHSPKKSSRKSRQSPETLRRKTPPPPTTKSLNMQIKDFIKHSSPPRARKISESSNSQFDAFNHTSSSKLSHASFKEHERSPCSKQSSLSQQHSGQYSENYEDYEYYHPRRSSKEVLDFTSSRKSLQEGKSSENEQVPFFKQHSHEENQKTEDVYYKRKDDPHRHCQCPSPRKESSKSFGDVPSPSLGRDEKEVFDFTSKKLSHYAGGTLTRRQRSKDSKNESKQRQRTLDNEIYSSPTSIKTSRRRKDDRNMFDFSAADGSEYATLRKKRCSSHKKHHSRDRELVSDCSRDYEKIGDVLDFTSSSDRRDALEFSSATKVESRSINNSQELLNIKSSTEFLSKSSSKEFSQRRQISDTVHDKSIDPWPESSTLSLPRQPKERDSRNKDYDSLGESPVNSKDDLSIKESLRDATIDPPDLFNTNKSVGPQNSTNPEDEMMLDHSKNYPDIPMHLYQSKIDSEEPIYVSRSGTLKKRFEPTINI